MNGDVPLSRKFFLALTQPLHKQMVRYFLTGAIDHSSRLFKSNLLLSPTCVYCNNAEETAKHMFWECTSWRFIRDRYVILMKFYGLCGSFWPDHLLHCGWILKDFSSGLHLLSSLNIEYDYASFVHDIHHMYLHILIQRYQTSQVLHQVPHTPIQHNFSSCVSVSSIPLLVPLLLYSPPIPPFSLAWCDDQQLALHCTEWLIQPAG